MKDEIIHNKITSISIRFIMQLDPLLQQKVLSEADFGKEIMDAIQEDYDDKIEELLKGHHQSVTETYSILMEKYELETDIRLMRGGSGRIFSSVTIKKIKNRNKLINKEKRMKVKKSKWRPYFHISESIIHGGQS